MFAMVGHSECSEKYPALAELLENLEALPYELNKKGKYSKRKRACIAYMESTVVDISILPPSFKPVSLSLSRISFILKHPNKSFFNPIKYILTSFYNTLFTVL